MSHVLEAYEGCYCADGYPDFTVKIEDGRLQACTMGGLPWSDLRHYHYDVFDWHISIWDTWTKTKFLINEAGEIGSVSIPMEPMVEDIVFVRKSVVIDALTLSAITGEYDAEIDGLRFFVSHKNGKIYWQESGLATIQVHPCDNRGSEIECRVNRSRVLFCQTEGKFSRLVLKAPGATFEARKRDLV